MKALSVIASLLMVLPILAASIFNTKVLVAAANVLSLGRSVETYQTVADGLVENTLTQAVAEGTNLSCNNDVSRSIATLRAFLLNRRIEIIQRKDQRSDTARLALAANEHRIGCSPADGNAWFMRSQILQVLEPNSDRVVASLANSYRFAPAELWVIQPRFNFALANFDMVNSKLSVQFKDNLNLISQFAPVKDVANDYVNGNSKLKVMIYDALTKMPADRQDAVAGETNRLGVTLRGNRKCEEGVALKPADYRFSMTNAGKMEMCGG